MVRRVILRSRQTGIGLDSASCGVWGLAQAIAAFAALALGIMSVVAMVLPQGSAEANGTSTIVFDETRGPYRLVVGILPARPVIPQTHLAIQVFDAADATLLRDTDVEMHVVAAGPPGASDFGPAQVLNEQTLRYFEVDVPFSITGPWQVSVTVSSERGEEEFVLDMAVGEPGARIQWIWIAGVMAAIVAVGIWTWLTLQRRRG